MHLEIKTAGGVAIFPDRFREYTNPYACRMVFSEDCFDHRFSFTRGLCRHYEDLWSEVTVVYQNVRGESKMPASDGVVYYPTSTVPVLGQVLRSVVSNMTDESVEAELRDGDTAFLYGKRRKVGRNIRQLHENFPVLSLPGDWELLCVIQRLPPS